MHMNTLLIDTKEKSILAALYKSGQSSVSNLAKVTLINRTTLYPLLEKLVKKGLVSNVQFEGKNLYEAISLHDLKLWAERKKNESIQTTNEFFDWAKEQTQGPKNILLTDIKYFEGLDGVKNLYHDTWRNNSEKMIYALTDYEKAYDIVGDEFLRNDYFKQRVNHGVHVKSLLPNSEIGKHDITMAKELLRDMRFIDLFQDLGIEINLYDNKVAIFAFDKHRPSGILIKNQTIAKAFKHIFEYLWKNGKSPNSI